MSKPLPLFGQRYFWPALRTLSGWEAERSAWNQLLRACLILPPSLLWIWPAFRTVGWFWCGQAFSALQLLGLFAVSMLDSTWKKSAWRQLLLSYHDDHDEILVCLFLVFAQHIESKKKEIQPHRWHCETAATALLLKDSLQFSRKRVATQPFFTTSYPCDHLSIGISWVFWQYCFLVNDFETNDQQQLLQRVEEKKISRGGREPSGIKEHAFVFPLLLC